MKDKTEKLCLTEIGPEETIYFGEELADGSNENHFHLGMTSKKLLQNINCVNIFHLDCTYKIVRYGFPLIVFGGTDLSRKFHLIGNKP